MDSYQVEVIKPGYCVQQEPGYFKADGTITLVKGPKNVVVDTGGPSDREVIISGLELHGLCPSDVHYAICTHGHSDHIGNLNLFPNAMVIVSHDISQGDLYISHDFDFPYMIDNDLQIISTPGHTEQDVSVIVRTTQGTFAIVGDLFESKNDLEDESIWQSLSLNPSQQAISRRTILQMADFIVPGHGEPFGVR